MQQLDWRQIYRPARITNQQLGDDWRLFVAAIANLNSGVDEPYTKKEIHIMAVACAKEIAKRVHSGDMKFTIGEDKGSAYEALWSEVKKKLEVWELSVLTGSLDSLPNKLQDSRKESKEELAPVNPSEIELGEEITLEELKKYFKSFYRTKPYVSLVGGICNNGKTKGDIDFFINATHKDEATEFRVTRMFPKEFWHRFQFIYPGDTHPGKFTNYIDIFNEKIEILSSPKLVLMSVPKNVELFKFAKLLKPTHGHFKGEEYEIENLLKIIDSKPEWYEKGIYVQKKFDGVHVRCDVQRNYESGYDVKIWTEEGNEITRKLPTLRAELAKISKDHAIAITGELEFWDDKEHQSRQQTTAIIHTKDVHPDEEKVILNVFDILYYDKTDIHKEPYSKRLELAKLTDMQHIKNAEYRIIHNRNDLENAIRYYSGMPGSEGAYLKRADFPYELDGKTQLNLKYKNTFSIDAEVKEIHKVRGSDAWNYLCTIRGKNGREVPIGRTYNTSIKLEEGNVVKVEFVNLNKYFDNRVKRTWYNWWSPRVIMARPDKKRSDTTETADKLVEASHGEIKNRMAKVALDADPYMTLPDESKKLLGMCHIHGRGKSIHGDLRFQVTSDYAVGWTLYIPKGLSKVPESYNEFKKLVDKEILPIVKEKLEDPTQKFNCGTKEPEPIEWLDYQGMVNRGGVGATKNEPGFFYIIDRFDVEFGVQKPHFHEYFCHGELFKGRTILTLLKNKESWKKTDEGLMTWMCSVALTSKTPYVISSRAVEKKWVPPYTYSALPADLKEKVPKDNKYWDVKDPKKRLEKRDELVAEIKRRTNELDATGPASYKVLRQTWKGQKVIREGASRTVYYFLICQGETAKFGLAFQNSPLKNNELTGLIAKEKNELCKIKAKTEIKPGTTLNPTRETPSEIVVMERGTATILSTTNFKRYRIKTGRMRGNWQAYNREDGSVMWTLQKIKAEE